MWQAEACSIVVPHPHVFHNPMFKMLTKVSNKKKTKTKQQQQQQQQTNKQQQQHRMLRSN